MSYRFERRLQGIGPIRRMTGLTSAEDFEEFVGVMLHVANKRPKIAEMFRDGELSASVILQASRDEDLGRLTPDPRVLVPLEQAFEKAMGNREGETVRRYRVSMNKFRRLASVNTVHGLASVDYESLARTWPGSPSDYMAFYRTLSHFLAKHFGGKRTGRMHPFRCAVMDMVPRRQERRRVPDVSQAVFVRLVSRTPDYAQPVYWGLLITGFRVRSEFLSLRREHLRPHVFEIEVPGTKTPESAGVIPIAPDNWHWIDRSVPSPIAYGQLVKHWHRACLSEGLATKQPDPCRPGKLRYAGPTLHDIRHLTAQFMTNRGAPEVAVQAYLRHSDPTTTRRYTMQRIRTEAADLLVGIA